MPLILRIGKKNGAWWKGLLAAGAGGAASAIQHVLTNGGSINFDVPQFKAMMGGAVLAMLLYFSKSPFHDGFSDDDKKPCDPDAPKE
jgi:hypothetical protein